MIIYILILALIFIGLDQFTKYLIVNNMALGDSNDIITNFFAITSHRNRGAAWGILENSRLFFLITTTIFLIGFFYYIIKQKNKLNNFDVLCFSLVIGGAIGNFIDRLWRHEVVDFLDFNLLGYKFPIFNLADTFICIGVFLLLIKVYREDEK